MELIEERRRILLNTPHIETISTSAFKTDMVAPFKKLEARFEAEQSGSGDPSPDNVRPIEGRTDMVVRHIGKNLWGKTLISGNVLLDNLEVGKTYTATADMKNPNTNTYFYIQRSAKGSETKTTIGYVIAGKDKKVITFTVAEGYDYWAFSNNSYTNVTNIQIEEGSEATEYESYTEPYYPLGKNLANPDTVIKGGYYSGSGAWSASTVSATTGLIRVKPNTTYVSSIFDNAGTRLNACVATLWNDATTCTGQITTQKFTTGSQTQFVRIRNFDAQGSYITNDDFKFQLEEGETPTAFEEYKGIGYKVNWGKNLLNASKFAFYKTGTILIDNSTEAGSNGSGYTLPFINVEPNTEYILSGEFTQYSGEGVTPVASGYRVYYYDENNNFLGRSANLRNARANPPLSFTTPANCTKLAIQCQYLRNYPILDKAQLEKGSKVTEYEPYIGEVYGGTVDLISGTLTVDRVKETFVFDNPTEDSTYNLESQRFTLAQRSTGASIATNKITNVCGNYAYAQASWQDGKPHFYIGTTSCIIYLTKNAYRGGEIEICYPLETPITYQLTPQQILTLKNNNTLMPEGSINELKYWTHI